MANSLLIHYRLNLVAKGSAVWFLTPIWPVPRSQERDLGYPAIGKRLFGSIFNWGPDCYRFDEVQKLEGVLISV